MSYRTIFDNGEYIIIEAENDDEAIESALFYADMLHREVADIEPEH